MKKISLLIIFITVFISCKKQGEWLDVKSNKSDVIPTTLEDFQALLDNTDVMNSVYPAVGIIGADNSYVLDQVATTGGTVVERNAYRWAVDIYEGNLSASDWTYPFKTIEYANVILYGLGKNNFAPDTRYNTIKGSALFFRAFAYYQLAQIYAKAYNENSASTNLGLPIKLDPDVNNLPSRSTLQETYSQMIQDLMEAEKLLPLNSDYKTRPSKIAARAMLSKLYLNMQNYLKALEYANLTLNSKSNLVDFNTLNTTVNFPFPTVRSDNPEIIFYAETNGYSFNNRQNLVVMNDLFQSYDQNDLRRIVFYKPNSNGTMAFGGRYTGGALLFCGVATNEILLIRSEAFARTGNLSSAMDDLNKLLNERWKKDNGVSRYVNQSANTEGQALTIILGERRKELPFTGNLRWEDLRRLNFDTRFAKTLSRTIAGNQFSLTPNSPKYVFPIPPIEININPLIQNIR